MQAPAFALRYEDDGATRSISQFTIYFSFIEEKNPYPTPFFRHENLSLWEAYLWSPSLSLVLCHLGPILQIPFSHVLALISLSSSKYREVSPWKADRYSSCLLVSWLFLSLIPCWCNTPGRPSESPFSPFVFHFEFYVSAWTVFLIVLLSKLRLKKAQVGFSFL